MENKIIDDFRLKGKLLCKVGDKYVIYKKGYLYIYDNLEKKWEKRKKFLNNLFDMLCSKIRFLERTLRLDPRTATVVSNNQILISGRRKIWNFNIDTLKLSEEHSFREGMNNILSFCNAINSEHENIILYGEYWPNKFKEQVNIYKRNEGRWEIVYTFPKKSIKHVHQIVYDQIKNRFMIATGDSSQETGIFEASSDFKNVKPLAKGDQKFRTCFLTLKDNTIYYPTDSPTRNNYIFSLCGNQLTSLYAIPGPCVFAKKISEHVFIISTSVECDPKTNLLKGILFNRLSCGIQDRYSHIIIYDIRGKIYEIGRYKKDFWSLILLFGNIMFPDIDDNYIYFTGIAVKKFDGCTGRIRLSEIEI